MKGSFLIFFMALKLVTSAQQPIALNNTFDNIQLVLNREKAFSREFKTGYEDIKGSPFLNKEFSKGKIYAQYGNFEGVEMKYDIYEGTFLIKLDEKYLYLDRLANTNKVVLDSVEFYLKNLILNNKPKDTFMELVSEGKLSLFAKKNILLKPAEPPKAMVDANPAQFIIKPDTYFLQLGTGNLMPFENFKDLFTLFPSNENGIKEKIKNEKLSFKKVADIKEIIKYCNQNI